ncbi:MAG: M48 family metallopeptidase [Gemmatimonadota bacterium]|nr:M48 family metallopeptidase [Gemmatimonadota bacterium]
MTRTRGESPRQAEELREQVRHWAEVLGVTPARIRVQRMTRKWGSCSQAGGVTFASALLARPAAFQRYVIVHELLHLRVRNHGRLFRSYLSAYAPDWRRYANGSCRTTPR